MSDWCFSCEKPLVRLSHGAYAECCDGIGYWSTFEPLPKDNLMPIIRAKGTVTGVLVHLYRRIGPTVVAL